MAKGDSRPWDSEPDAASFGQWLRRQREVREIGLREIAETSKISVRYLEALEQDRFDLLPAPVFARGFLREYSKFVGLDPDEVVNYFISALPEEVGEEEEREKPPGDSRSRFVGPLVVVLLLLLGVAALFSHLASRGRGEAQPGPQNPPAQTQQTFPGQPTEDEVSDAPIRLALDFNQNSWVEVYIDGERRVSELRVQGESLRAEAERELRVTLGNVAGVAFELNGRAYDPGAADQEEVVVDLALAREVESGSLQ